MARSNLLTVTHVHLQHVDEVLPPVNPDFPVPQRHDDPFDPLRLVIHHLHQRDGIWQLVNPLTLTLIPKGTHVYVH